MKTIEEAQLEVSLAGAFGRTPADWATRLVAEQSTAGVDPLALFREAGFCEEDAVRGVRLLAVDESLGFEGVASTMSSFDDEFRRRNPYVTRQRIAEAAKKASGATPVSEVASTTFVDGRKVQL